jgi:hypothetical protein
MYQGPTHATARLVALPAVREAEEIWDEKMEPWRLANQGVELQ